MLADIRKLLQGPELRALNSSNQADLCRTMLHFIRHARNRGDVQMASQVFANLDAMLKMGAATQTSLSMLCHKVVSVEVCGGAAVGAAVTLLCSGSQILLLLICVALACWLINLKAT